MEVMRHLKQERSQHLNLKWIVALTRLMDMAEPEHRSLEGSGSPDK